MASAGRNDGHNDNDAMKIRFKIDQADLFRRGIDAPKSVVSIEVNPADLPQETRDLIARHLEGIDVMQCREGGAELVMAKDPTLESLVERLRQIEKRESEAGQRQADQLAAMEELLNPDKLYQPEED